MRKIVANNSLYDVYFGSGQKAGQYEAQKQEVSDVWSDIDYSKQLTAQRGERRERNLDTILAATELTSQIGQGMEAKKEFKGQLGSVEGKLKTTGERVGRSGKAWEDTGFIEKLFSGKQYKFGSGESAKVMDKAQISVAGQQIQSGIAVNFDRFKPPSAAAEVGLSDQSTQSADGDHYGKRKGFDLGDVFGKQSVASSVYGSGKEKLSSILSPKEKTSNLPDYLKRQKEDPIDLGAGSDRLKLDKPKDFTVEQLKELQNVKSFEEGYPEAQTEIEEKATMMDIWGFPK